PADVRDDATPLPAELRGLGYVPEERQRAFHDAADILAPRMISQEEAGRCEYDIVERGLVETPRRGLFLLERLRIEPGGHFLLNVRNIRPAEPGGVATGTDRDIDRRIDAIRARMP